MCFLFFSYAIKFVDDFIDNSMYLGDKYIKFNKKQIKIVQKICQSNFVNII